MGTRSLLLLLFLVGQLWAHGVAVLDATQCTYLPLRSVATDVQIENQVAQVSARAVFRNQGVQDAVVKYAFPLPDGASATRLRWFIEGAWHEASFAPTPQDTTMPGEDDMHYTLRQYLGENPVYYEINDPVQVDSLLIVELDYVELLPYNNGTVSWTFPADYHLLQTAPLVSQELELSLFSEREITALWLNDDYVCDSQNDGHEAGIQMTRTACYSNVDYEVGYQLSSDDLGLFALSTMLPDSLIPDEGMGGYFTFIAEPDPEDQGSVIEKVFTLVIDCSGSMSGNKIVQARQAASYIVNNLNEGDRFNLIGFSSTITSFSADHVEFNPTTQSQALTWIGERYAAGGTFISGVLQEAVQQYDDESNETANIIIFFTDGQPTVGIINEQNILTLVSDEIESLQAPVYLFPFGIGHDVNHSLLGNLAQQNNGLVQFVEDSELEVCITDFYNLIRYPVLLSPSIVFDGCEVNEVYPIDLPNLYMGRQLLVSGRHSGGPCSIALHGTVYGEVINYTYNLTMSDEDVENRRFLTKIWAAQKIEYLTALYYTYDEDSQEAQELEEEITALSIAYGVLSEFTSFGEEVDVEEPAQHLTTPLGFVLKGNHPNPFNPSTTINFEVTRPFTGAAVLRIYNMMGQLVRELRVLVNGTGEYTLVWDGRDTHGVPVASGSYVYTLNVNDALAGGKMTLLR